MGFAAKNQDFLWNPLNLNPFFFSVVIGESAVSKQVTIDPMSNETVAVGRDATLQCVVKHLQDYKVSRLSI